MSTSSENRKATWVLLMTVKFCDGDGLAQDSAYAMIEATLKRPQSEVIY